MKHHWSVFTKDGLELLRDRRTLFVNVVLPVLLYPVMLIFLIQVYQLTQAHRPPPPVVLTVGVDEKLVAVLRPAEAVDRENSSKKADIDLQTADDEVAAIVSPIAERVLNDPKNSAAQQQLLAMLRANDLQAASLLYAGAPAEDGRPRLLVAFDDADPQFDRVNRTVDRGLKTWRNDLVIARLAQAGLPPETLTPVVTSEYMLAPAAQATRMRLAGLIPLLLVVMAVSGAFYPALDLIAGERERGTLETLLTWPVSRRSIFLGKLMVTICAALVAVVLNLCSLGITVALAGSQLAPPGSQADLSGLFAVGIGTIALSFLALLPLVVTLSAISLALAGFAASSKEAQNYLTPLFLVVVMAAAVAQVPDAAPTLALDLVPITGPVLALKEALRSPTIPWLHLLVSTASSVALATVVVSWSVRLLDSESFCYPGLVRAGWGRWRRWGKGPNAPGGLEALGLFALCAAAFLLLGPQLKYFGNVAQIAGPLLLCLGAPVLLYVWAGRYSARSVHLGLPPASSWARGVLAIPLAVSLSIALSTLQPAPPPGDEQAAQMRQMFEQLEHQGGIALILAVIALAPGICEELLCRGPLLAGLRRGLGTSGAVLVSAFCFAVLHLSPYRFLPQFAIGVFLALLTLRSGSLWPGVIVHVGHNALAVLLSGGDESDEPQLSTSLACVIGALALVGLGLLVRPRAGGQALAKDQTTPLVDAQS